MHEVHYYILFSLVGSQFFDLWIIIFFFVLKATIFLVVCVFVVIIVLDNIDSQKKR